MLVSRSLSSLVLVLAVVAGCSAEPPTYEGETQAAIAQDEPPVAASALRAGDAPFGSPGCGSDQAERGVSSKRISVRGVQRTYVLSVPESYEPQRRHRLIFGWHGLGLSGAQMRSFVAAIEGLAGDEAVFVYPNTSIDGGTRHLDRSANGPDVALFDALVETIAASYCIDPRLVFSIGFSDGAFFTNSLAQARPAGLRGIVPIAGGGGGGVSVAAMVIHSRDDSNVGIGYGLGSVRQWGAANACRSEDFGRYPLGVCRPLADCREEYPVVFCQWGRTSPNQGTHDWPRFPSANQDIWGFLSR